MSENSLISKLRWFIFWWIALSAVLFVLYLSLPVFIPQIVNLLLREQGVDLSECRIAFRYPSEFESSRCVVSMPDKVPNSKFEFSHISLSFARGFQEPHFSAKVVTAFTPHLTVKAEAAELFPKSSTHADFVQTFMQFDSSFKNVIARYQNIDIPVGDVRIDVDLQGKTLHLTSDNKQMNDSARKLAYAAPIKANFTYLLETQSGKGSIAVGPMDLQKLEQFLSAKRGFQLPFKVESGSAEMSAVIPIEDGSVGKNSSLSVRLRDLDSKTEAWSVLGLEANLQIIGFPAWRTEPQSKVSIRSVDFGVPISNLSFRPKLLGLPNLSSKTRFENIRAEAFGGTLMSEHVEIVDKVIQPIVLEVEAIDLEKLLLLAGNTIQGDGKLSGQIPIEFDEGLPVVKAGKLLSLAPGGSLRYVRKDTEDSTSSGDAGLDFALQALEQFRYETMQVSLNYDKQGTLLAGVAMKGRNEKISATRPIEFNVNIEENIPSLLKSVRALTKSPTRSQ